MVPEIGNEMRGRKLLGKLLLRRLRPLAIDKLKEIKSNSDSIDANQIGDVFNVIDVTIESAFISLRTYQYGVNANYTTAFADHFDLVIADVPLDVVIMADIRVRDNWWLCRDRQDILEASRIDVSEIDNHAKDLAFSHQIPTKPAKTLLR